MLAYRSKTTNQVAEERQTSSGGVRIVRSALIILAREALHILILVQREHSANIMEAPKVYAMQDPPKAMNVITIDCRGLEFVEFKADVCIPTDHIRFCESLEFDSLS